MYYANMPSKSNKYTFIIHYPSHVGSSVLVGTRLRQKFGVYRQFIKLLQRRLVLSNNMAAISRAKIKLTPFDLAQTSCHQFDIQLTLLNILEK